MIRHRETDLPDQPPVWIEPANENGNEKSREKGDSRKEKERHMRERKRDMPSFCVHANPGRGWSGGRVGMWDAVAKLCLNPGCR